MQGERERTLTLLRSRIAGFVSRRLTPERSKEIAQEATALLSTRYEHVVAIEELVPLAFRIARFKLAMAIREGCARGAASVGTEEVDFASAQPEPHEFARREEALRLLEKALAAAESRTRELFRHKLAGSSLVEIQRAIAANSFATVWAWDQRGRQELRDRLGPGWAGAVRP